MNDLQFCSFETHQFEAIRSLLCSTFNTSDEELLSFYQALRADFNKIEWPHAVHTSRSFFTSQDSCSQASYDNAKIIGCDLPSLLSKGGQSTVMIVAQDPYSTTKSNHIGIGTPYAMHIKRCREELHTRRYFQLIDVLLEQGYQTYLTDIYKIYMGGVGLGKRDCQRFANVLKQEIEIIKPVAIVTWGKTATNAVDGLKLENSHYAYPHPSGAARWTWAKLIQDKATDQNILNYWKQDILQKLSTNARVS